MPRPSDEALAMAPAFAPVLGFRPRGQLGDRMGPGVGASLEFEDRRVYAPGDDVRHVDWQVLARTGELLVRVHREEIQPRLDVLVDASASMATEPEKEQAAVDLAGLFARAGDAAGYEVRVVRLGARPEIMAPLVFEREGIEFDERMPLGDALRAARPLLVGGGLWLCVSDFLAEGGLGLRGLAGRRGATALLQVLGPWESDPPVGDQLQLVDSEGAGARDLVLDPGLVREYRKRLERVSDELSQEARRLGMRYTRVTGGAPLRAIARDLLVPAGLLEPA